MPTKRKIPPPDAENVIAWLKRALDLSSTRAKDGAVRATAYTLWHEWKQQQKILSKIDKKRIEEQNNANTGGRG